MAWAETLARTAVAAYLVLEGHLPISPRIDADAGSQNLPAEQMTIIPEDSKGRPNVFPDSWLTGTEGDLRIQQQPPQHCEVVDENFVSVYQVCRNAGYSDNNPEELRNCVSGATVTHLDGTVEPAQPVANFLHNGDEVCVPFPVEESFFPSGQPPVITEQPPVITEQAPVVTEQPPVITEQAPVVTEQAPVTNAREVLTLEPASSEETSGSEELLACSICISVALVVLLVLAARDNIWAQEAIDFLYDLFGGLLDFFSSFLSGLFNPEPYKKKE